MPDIDWSQYDDEIPLVIYDEATDTFIERPKRPKFKVGIFHTIFALSTAVFFPPYFLLWLLWHIKYFLFDYGRIKRQWKRYETALESYMKGQEVIKFQLNIEK